MTDGSEPTTPPAAARPRNTRKRVTAGVAGLAALLGGGAYLTTSAIMDADKPAPSETVNQAVRISEPLDQKPGDTTPSPVPTTDASGSPLPQKVVDEIKEARRKMAESGVKVQRPFREQSVEDTDDVKRTTKGSLKEGGIVRIVTARKDLTGQSELAYVAGGIKKHGDASCSQTFQFSSNPTPAKRKNLLMCWRTTDAKSVLAIVVDPKGKPSRDKAVAALEKSWSAMD
ncbi:hypothetical protein [Actinoplanes sp. G11-F43]|uniref:hypothetical protein n=1 Tax=Actinoplanes sp. G11-F43 TaxID=3424130 RepID=UPI003D34B0EB